MDRSGPGSLSLGPTTITEDDPTAHPRRATASRESHAQFLRRGNVIRFSTGKGRWQLPVLPLVSPAFSPLPPIFFDLRILVLVVGTLGIVLPCQAQSAFINEFHTDDANQGYIDHDGDGTPEAFTDLEFVEFAIDTESDTPYDASDVVALFYEGDGTYADYAIGPSYWEREEEQGKYTVYSYGPFSIPLNQDPDHPPEGALPDGEGAVALTWWDETEEVLHLIDLVSYGDTVSITNDQYVGSVTAPPIKVDEQPAPASDTSALDFYSLGLTGVLETSSQNASVRPSKNRSAEAPPVSASLLLRRPEALLNRIRRSPTQAQKARTASFSSTPDNLEWTVFANTASPGQPNSNQSLPIELVRFDGVATESGAVLSWSTASETANAGFSIEHAHHSQAFSEVAFVESPGPSDTLRTYEYRLSELTPGRHRFRLRQVDINGQITYSRPIQLQVSGSDALHVSPPAPTPFRTQSTVTVSTERATPLTVSVHDALGREVTRLWTGTTQAGQIYEFRLSTSRDNLSPGVYLIRVRTPTRSKTRKTVLVR